MKLNGEDKVTAIEGSREIGPEAEALVSRVCRSLLSSGFSLATGCCVGVDSAVVSAALRLEAASRLHVFCAFGPSEVFKVPAVCNMAGVFQASRAGASVHWSAGSSGPVRARFAARSVSLVRFVAASRSRSGLVAFVGRSCPAPVLPGPSWRAAGSGSWGSVALAVGLGLPVVVFPLSSSVVLPEWPGGSWVVAGSGVWASGFRWVSEAPLLEANSYEGEES